MGYEASAVYYDLFGEKPDIPYYTTLGKTYGSAAELGVGTARVAIELARAGVNVVGIDNSEKMLEIAQEKIARCSQEIQERITLYKAEMTNFQLSHPVPLVYIPSSGLSHCITPTDQLACLTCIYEHLEPGGLLACDLHLPGQSYSSALTQAGIREKEGKTIVRWISNRADFSKHLLYTTLIFEEYTRSLLTKRILEHSCVGLIFRDDFLSLLKKTGFEVENVYGDFTLSPRVTDLLVVEARKPKSF
ncbi:MAG: class I SAM-dependent methyltransferase [Theionarchaea archaeon]|nr:class I SAM-dependent methyltransferase [Theionarchaea archaeon]